ncbi:MAG: L-seryl-tRNA(Sec) selenium transferase [Desulfococcus sp. 4484_241]|nr:MAG: L-seryl-tRNA(Sec) selenium transferase [Desulfococcus sp. 4484_241]
METKKQLTDKQQKQLRQLPGIDTIIERLQKRNGTGNIPPAVLAKAARDTVSNLRADIKENEDGVPEQWLAPENLENIALQKAQDAMRPNLKPLVNGTGVVIHTNLGRSPLCRQAIDHLTAVASGYSNLEFDLSAGKRGIRYACVEELICEFTGAQAAMAVNNNAGAVLLGVETFARGREVIVSRGELVEIGGSFRIPDVIKKSGAILKEVGTTNRTHLKDYENAISPDTGMLLKVHTSNYGMVGFTAEVGLKELAELGKRHNIPVMNDLGSGTLVDLSRYGLVREPTVMDAVSTGADLVTFSGDKLLGGPQAGILVGKKEIISSVRSNPLTRALRIDKLTLAALEMTLRAYREPEKLADTVPTLRMLAMPAGEVRIKAEMLAKELESMGDRRLEANVLPLVSKPGGGAMPFVEIPSSGVAVTVEGFSPNRLEQALRKADPPVIGRIEDDRFVIDLRTVAESELSVIKSAFCMLLAKHKI